MDTLFKEISRPATINLIAAVGRTVTVLVEGAIGSGKSAVLQDLAARFKDTHKAVYIDMTMLDIGDLQLPAADHGTCTMTFYPNESLGLHEDRPMIIMFDEFGKASPSVKNAVLPMLIERRVGNRKFHPDTIVFATTNLGAENVGDLFKPHERNRMSFVRMAKPTADEWLHWALDNGVPAEVCAWVKQNPQCFDSFEDYKNPADNPYIFHPQAPRTAFVTHRSMTQAGHIVAQRAMLGDEALTHALMGTIGQSAAMDMMNFVRMGDTLPSRDQIFSAPATTPVPTSPAAIVMLSMQSLGWLDAGNIDAWMTYLQRFPSAEVIAMWATLAVKSNKVGIVTSNAQFTKWVMDNSFIF